MFALSLTIYEIFANLITFQNFHLENEGQVQGGEKRELRSWTVNVRFCIGDFFFRIVATWEHTVAQTGNTHTQEHTRSERQE